jgi:hypothetical protein
MVVVDDSWHAGLSWHDPMVDGSECSEDPELESALAALRADARAINSAFREVEKAAGQWHDDAHGVVDVLTERAEARFFSAPYLACEHADDLVYVHLWAGPVAAAVCSDEVCQLRLDRLIESSRRFAWCGMCDCRSEWLQEITVAITSVANGRLMTPVHLVCLRPELAIS